MYIHLYNTFLKTCSSVIYPDISIFDIKPLSTGLTCLFCISRALVAIEILKQIEEISRRPIYELFDYVCGVSTGSLLGAMMSIWRVPLSDIEHIYKEFSTDMFTRSRWVGALTSVRSHSYYNTQEWEKILQ